MILRTLQKYLFQAVRDPGETRSILWHFIVNTIAGSHLVPARLRTAIYIMAGMSVSWRAIIRPHVIIRDRNLSLGARSTINYGCVIDNRGLVTIGTNVGIGIGVIITTTHHGVQNPLVRAGVGSVRPISIGNGVYVGSGATILGGVAVARGSVIAAGAVVVHDTQADRVYAGVPAKPIGTLPTEQSKPAVDPTL